MTAPDEVKIFKRGSEVVHETVQMEKRIEYVRLDYTIPEAERKEVLRHCGQCTARLYLEGACLPCGAAGGQVNCAKS